MLKNLGLQMNLTFEPLTMGDSRDSRCGEVWLETAMPVANQRRTSFEMTSKFAAFQVLMWPVFLLKVQDR